MKYQTINAGDHSKRGFEMENGKIKCNLCNEEYSADACKSFTYGRLDVNICPTCLVWSSHEWAVMARKTLRQKKGRR